MGLTIAASSWGHSWEHLWGQVDLSWGHFWEQVDLLKAPNGSTITAAFGIAFLACCATQAVYDMIRAGSDGVPPWDRIKRGTPRRRFWTYLGLRATLAVGCGIIGLLVCTVPVLAVIAAGVVPLAVLKSLSGGPPGNE